MVEGSKGGNHGFAEVTLAKFPKSRDWGYEDDTNCGTGDGITHSATQFATDIKG